MLVEAVELTLEEITSEEYEFRDSGQMLATSDVPDDDPCEDSTLVESGEIEVKVDLPFVPAR